MTARRLGAVLAAVCLLARSTGAADLPLRLPVPNLPLPARLLAPPPPPKPVLPDLVAPPEPARTAVTPDRMLVVKEQGFEGVAGVREDGGARRLARARPFHMPWLEAGGLRLRVTYLDSVGVMWGVPLYPPRATVKYVVELENAGALPLRGLRLISRQERYQPDGGAGPALGRDAVEALPALPLGGRAVVKGAFKLSPGDRPDFNFEQTHLTVVHSGPASETVVLDAPQAGIADPPGLE